MKLKSMYEHHTVDVLFLSIFRDLKHTSLRYKYVLRLSWTTFLKNLHDFHWSFPVLNGRALAMIKLPTSFHLKEHGKVSTTNSRGGNQKLLFFWISVGFPRLDFEENHLPRCKPNKPRPTEQSHGIYARSWACLCGTCTL